VVFKTSVAENAQKFDGDIAPLSMPFAAGQTRGGIRRSAGITNASISAVP
jgi:hypothetical protein